MTSRETTPVLPLAGSADIRPPDTRPYRDRLFTWAFFLLQWPFLLRALSGGPPDLKAALLDDLGLPPGALPNLGSWKADAGFLALLAEEVRVRRPETVVEFGCGASSLVLGRALARNGRGTLLSFDQHAAFVAATRAWLGEYGIAADIRVAPLAPPPAPWPGAWYAHGPLPERIDLLVVDGPPWTVHPFVRGAAEVAFPNLAVGGRVVLDDGARPGERIVMARWQRRWPNFRFDRVRAGTKGTVVGERLY
ncbi:class I SAM-dependent methyltransferase [Thermaurantiacus sp.]